MNFHTLSVSITPSSSSSSLVPCTPKTYLCSNINNESSRVNSPAPSQLTTKRRCLFCGRRHFVEAATLATTLFPIKPSRATNNSDSDYDYADVLNQFHPPKPDWYEEFYAWVMNSATKSYEAEVAKYKSQVLSNLKGKALKILEVGIGTGPNLSYYANDSDVHVVGIDPNPKMEKYARSSARLAGLLLSNFEFFQAVGEAIPLSDASVDAVVGTLVLCSVKDVDLALKERRLQVTAKKKVKRVLRPGGKYVFVEHLAAKADTCRWVPPFKRYRKQHIQSWIFKC
nr:methyltransferase-like protein 7A isoform X3 [Arachis hypogaea]